MSATFVCVACCKEHEASSRSGGRQSYCGTYDCQRARKATWKRESLAADADHRANQRRSFQEWSRANPGYWTDYRHDHPDKAERNRQMQRERNRRRPRKGPIAAGDVIAKVDASPSTSLKSVENGEYWLVPVMAPVIAKVDALKVRLTVIPATCE